MTDMQRLLRRAAVVVTASAAVVATAAGPAAAVSRFPGTIQSGASGYCSYSNWDGVFFCDSDAYWPKPDTYPQVFVVGPDRNVYTRWSSATTVSGWQNMGGTCKPDPGIEIRFWVNDWGLTINCKGTDNAWYHRERYDNGRWDAQWIKGYAYPS
ncbi:hypothetical protein [Actinoplanes sp. NPDC026670]|uniref:hypothetical protein n=1 Tax=Actinoplanes sp. NPDC026670 TaxID=3154700 RepID=UPI0033D77AC3